MSARWLRNVALGCLVVAILASVVAALVWFAGGSTTVVTRDDGVQLECLVLGGHRVVTEDAITLDGIQPACADAVSTEQRVLRGLLLVAVLSLGSAMVVGVIAYRRSGTFAPGQPVGGQAR